MDTNNRLTVMNGGMARVKTEKRTMFHHLSTESPKPTGNPLEEEDDEFITKVVENIEQAIPLIEAGFTQAADYNGVKIFKISLDWGGFVNWCGGWDSNPPCSGDERFIL